MSKVDKVFFIVAIVSCVATPAFPPASLVTGFCLGWLVGPLLLDDLA